MVKKKKSVLLSFLLQYLLILVTLFMVRVWFFHINNDGTLTTYEILKGFLIGLKFDGSMGGYLMAFLLFGFLLTKLLPWKKLFYRLTIFVYSLVAFVTIYFSIGNAHYYKMFKTQLDASIFEYAFDMEVQGDIIKSLNVPVIYSVICILTIINIILTIKVLKKLFLQERGGNLLKGIAEFLLIIMITFIGIRGLSHRPRNVEHGFFSKKELANQLTFNGMFSLMKSVSRQIKDRNVDLESLKFFSDDEVIKRSRDLVGRKGNTFLSDTNPLLRITKTGKPLKKKNVVLIITESFSGQYIGALGHNDPNLAPFFSELSKKGVLFTSFYGNGTRTRNGVLSTNVSFPVQVGLDFMRSAAAQKPFYGLPRILRDRGYSTTFFHGSRLNFDNMQGVLLTNGMENFVGKRDFPEEITSKYHWGAPDDVLMDRVADDITNKLSKGKKPFFAEVLTISNHSPFEIPKKYDRLESYKKQYGSRDKNADNDDSLMLRYNAYRYTDTAFKEFFTKIKDKPWFKDTLFVIVSDHEIDGMEHNIPLLLYTPDGSLKPQRIEKVGAQVDILPTIMGYLGGEYKNAAWGKDLLNTKDGEFFAYTKTPKAVDKAVIMYKDYFYYKNGKHITLRNRKTMKELSLEGKEKDLKKMDDLIKLHLQLSETMVRKRTFGDVKDDKSKK